MIERLQKLLAQAGVASRRHAEEMISAGRVRVNGKVITELGTQVDPSLDKVLVDNQPVELEPKAYYILNKPRGYISDRDDTSNLKTALDLVPDGLRLFAAGRLDLMSEGMLFLTNDGALANRLTHPRFEHEKEYLALVLGAPDDKTVARLEKGILYDGEWMRADVAERAGRNQDVGEAGRDETWLRIVLHEGKKRQIRHMCAALGHPVKRLVRVRMGGLKLGNLKVGEWRKLSADEVSQLTKSKPRASKHTPRAAAAKSKENLKGERAEKPGIPPRIDTAPRMQGPKKAENFPPRRDGPARRDAAPRRDGPAGKNFSPRREGAPRRDGPPNPDKAPRQDRPHTGKSFAPRQGGLPRGAAHARYGGPAGKNVSPRREGAPRRDESPRRAPPTRTSFAPGRGGSPRTGGGSAPRRDEGPRRAPPTRTSFAPGRGGSPRTGGGGAPRRDGPPSGKSWPPRRDALARDDRKRTNRDGGNRGNFKPPRDSKPKTLPPRAPKGSSSPSSHKPTDKRRDK